MDSIVRLRALEPGDIDFLYQLENDMDLWYLSHQQQPMSRMLLMKYIQEADKSIYEVGQFRLAIEKTKGGELLGFIDLFDFDPKNKRAGIGIIIKNSEQRNRGYGKAALQQLIKYCFRVLHLHQIYANIAVDNPASIRLFESLGFERSGLKKEWNFDGENYQDEYFYQLINK